PLLLKRKPNPSPPPIVIFPEKKRRNGKKKATLPAVGKKQIPISSPKKKRQGENRLAADRERLKVPPVVEERPRYLQLRLISM
ncbi:MAG: hypothetical protein D6805_10160, partial [Planctomycetota bacterium]